MMHKSHRGAPVVVVLEAEVVSLQQVELLAHLLEQQPPARLRLKILHVSSRNTLCLVCWERTLLFTGDTNS